MTLVDSFGRKVTGLRIALTPHCNLRCTYCHHEGEVTSAGEITKEVVVCVAKAAAELGYCHVKFTVGAPDAKRLGGDHRQLCLRILTYL
jgi:cyclic pyranopterin phosphate synthase